MPKIRYVIDYQGSLRALFSVMETKDGSLNIQAPGKGMAYSAPTLNELIAVSDKTLFENCSKHISIHPSLDSPILTTIKRTTKYKDRPQYSIETGHHYSTGIKQDNQFIPILFRVFGDLSLPRYLSKPDKSDVVINLGAFNPEKSQLRLMVVCSNTNKSFPIDPEQPRNHQERKFTHFTLTLIWSFLGQPSHSQAIDFFLQTKNQDTPMRGLVWEEIYNLYNDLNLTHALNYLEKLGIK